MSVLWRSLKKRAERTGFVALTKFGSISVSGQLPTYPSPNSIDCRWVRGGVGRQLPRYWYWSQSSMEKLLSPPFLFLPPLKCEWRQRPPLHRSSVIFNHLPPTLRWIVVILIPHKWIVLFARAYWVVRKWIASTIHLDTHSSPSGRLDESARRDHFSVYWKK